jgi:hypothetical protein
MAKRKKVFCRPSRDRDGKTDTFAHAQNLLFHADARVARVPYAPLCQIFGVAVGLVFFKSITAVSCTARQEGPVRHRGTKWARGAAHRSGVSTPMILKKCSLGL